MPSCSALPSCNCNSFAEHNMPCDISPRNFASLILKSFGKTAPTVATATLIPARAFGAPQTIFNNSFFQTLTSQQDNLSALGCCTRETTSPTTTPENYLVAKLMLEKKNY